MSDIFISCHDIRYGVPSWYNKVDMTIQWFYATSTKGADGWVSLSVSVNQSLHSIMGLLSYAVAKLATFVRLCNTYK